MVETKESTWSFDQIYDEYKTSIYNYVYHLVGDREQADDLTQDTFLKAFRALPKMDGSLKLSAWLYRIATNCSLDLVRSKKRRSENVAPADPEMDDPILSLPSGDPTPERMALSGEVRDRVSEAMQELSPTERTAFVLRHFEGMCIEEVSRVLDCQPGAAKHSVFRAVQKLRRALEPVVSAAK